MPEWKFAFRTIKKAGLNPNEDRCTIWGHLILFFYHLLPSYCFHFPGRAFGFPEQQQFYSYMPNPEREALQEKLFAEEKACL